MADDTLRKLSNKLASIRQNNCEALHYRVHCYNYLVYKRINGWGRVATHYVNSFAVKAARLWNILPKEFISKTTLGGLKEARGNFLDMFPDNPPSKGYTATNNNSLLEWTNCQDHQLERKEDVRDK